MMSSTPSCHGCYPEPSEGSSMRRRRKFIAAPRMTRGLGRVLRLAASAFSFAGCDGQTPQFTPVMGKVSCRGISLPVGTIVFAPDSDRGNNGPMAKGSIQPDGKYMLKT